jgi:putative transposase
MRRYIRANIPGATYFFTVALEDRRARWLVEHVDLLRDSVAQVKARHPFTIDAMVVLPDHLHALWTLPPDDADFATRWMLTKQGFARRLRAAVDLQARGVKGERVLWQRRYWEHLVRDDEDFARHVDYIHFNPVKHGHVGRAVDWPHSSFHRHVRQGTLPADWGVADSVRRIREAGVRLAHHQPTRSHTDCVTS